MRHIRYLAISLAVLGTSLFVGCVDDLDSSEPSAGERVSAAQLLNVRSGPGFNYPVVYQVPAGTKLQIECYTNDPAGNTWYKLADGNFILASVVPFTLTGKCVGLGFT